MSSRFGKTVQLIICSCSWHWLNAENEMFLLVEKRLFVKSGRSMLQGEYIIDIMTPGGGKKMAVPGMVPEAIFPKKVF